jgi:hypothetical protein
MTKCPRTYPGHACWEIMGKKLGVERGSLEILLHLLGVKTKLLMKAPKTTSPLLLIKNERSLTTKWQFLHGIIL